MPPIIMSCVNLLFEGGTGHKYTQGEGMRTIGLRGNGCFKISTISIITAVLLFSANCALAAPPNVATPVAVKTLAPVTGPVDLNLIVSVPGVIQFSGAQPEGNPPRGARACADLCLKDHNPRGNPFGNPFTDIMPWWRRVGWVPWGTWAPSDEYYACNDACNIARNPNGCEDNDNSGTADIDEMCDNKTNQKNRTACRDGCNEACGSGTCTADGAL